MASQNTTKQTEVTWGDERTNANDFTMHDATTQGPNNLELALLHLQDSPTATDIVDAAAGGDVFFDHSDLYADQALPDGSGVVWNPDVGLQLSDGDVISPAAALGSARSSRTRSCPAVSTRTRPTTPTGATRPRPSLIRRRTSSVRNSASPSGAATTTARPSRWKA